MGKLMDLLKNKGHHLMTIFIIVQIIIFLVFTFLFFWDANNEEIKYYIYIWAVLAIFLGYVVYFAYHSIKRAYFIELIAFLFMSTLSSLLLVFSFFYYVITSPSIDQKKRDLYSGLGIACVVLLVIGNIIYFISAYFAYEHFELIFMEKLGAKQIFHDIFQCIQFNLSMLKSDIGLVSIAVLAYFIFDNDNLILLITDSLFACAILVFFLCMRKFIKEEMKCSTYIAVVIRILCEGYQIYRVYELLNDEEDHRIQFRKFVFPPLCVISTTIFDAVILLVIIVFTIKCVGYYGKGYKKMLLVMQQAKENSTNDEMMISTSSEL